MTGLPHGAQSQDLGTQQDLPSDAEYRLASHQVSLTPSGPLPSATTLTFSLDGVVAPGTPVVAETRESADQPWTYLPATLASDGKHASVVTDHFSIFGILALDTAKVAAGFTRQFLDDLSNGATQSDVAKPTCTQESQARGDGYSITSDTTDTVYWCFGEDQGHRVLKVANHRRYPLEVYHPNMAVEQNATDWGQWSSLSKLTTGATVIISPNGTATFNADLNPGDSEGINTEMDGLGQSIYALQTGVTALVAILTRFGASEGTAPLKIADKLLTAESCTAAIGHGPGALLAGCFSPAQILEAFGVKGLLLAPIMAVGGVVAFFHSEWNALTDIFTGHDQYKIGIARAASPPLLGLSFAPYQEGFGTVAPTSVFNGGDPTGAFTIAWDNWGGTTADGHGTALWVGDDQTVADGTEQPAQFRAYDLGTCQGQNVYLHLAVWFPQHGQSFDPATNSEAFYTLCPS